MPSYKLSFGLVLHEASVILAFKEAQKEHFLSACFAGIGMFAERKVEMRTASEDGLGVCELAETPFAVVCAHAGMTCSVERHAFDHHMDADLVDATAAELLCLHDAVCPAHIAREQIHS